MWTSFKDDSDEQPYDVAISYVLIPANDVLNGVLYGGVVSETDDDGTVVYPGRNRSGRAIGGFGIGYYRNDEHLLKIGVQLDRSGATVILRDNDTRESINPQVVSRILPVE